MAPLCNIRELARPCEEETTLNGSQIEMESRVTVTRLSCISLAMRVWLSTLVVIFTPKCIPQLSPEGATFVL